MKEDRSIVKTEKEALEITIKLWDHLASTGGDSKSNAVEALGLPHDMKADCALCEYTEAECSECPLKGKWGPTDSGSQCDLTGNLFDRWEYGYREERIEAASGIVEAAKERLLELNDTRKVKTEKEALEWTVKLWKRLAETGREMKGTTLQGLGLPSMRYDCPLCEYSNDTSNGIFGTVDCSKCPLKGEWTTSAARDCQCCSYDSPYESWKNTRSEAVRQEAAAKIWKMAQKKLDEINGVTEETRLQEFMKTNKKPQVGDLVEVLKGYSCYYKTGDRGIVLRVQDNGKFFTDFNNQMNPSVYDDGKWFPKYVKVLKTKQELEEERLDDFMKQQGPLKAGDLVEVIADPVDDEKFFRIGDRGVVLDVGCGRVYIDFNNQEGNSSVYKDGRWCATYVKKILVPQVKYPTDTIGTIHWVSTAWESVGPKKKTLWTREELLKTNLEELLEELKENG
jgi:hypothetical protein